MKITGILVPEDMDKSLERIEFEQGDIETMQGHVGGNFQLVEINRPNCTLWSGMEAKSCDGWEINRRATLLLWLHATQFRRMDSVAGDAFITGPADPRGNTMSVPEQLVKLLFDTSRFKAEVQTEQDGGWYGNALAPDFTNWVEAYNYALQLADRLPSVLHVRVVPA
jgi:hypothetical protein